MVTVVDDPKAAHPRHPRRRPSWPVTVGALATLGLILGVLGWLLPSPGRSLAVPTLIVLATGCAAVLIYWFGVSRSGRHLDWKVAVAILGIAVVASIWTFAFSLPASLVWNSGATLQARAAIARPNRPTKNPADESYLPCSVVRSAPIGPLDAPYQVCVGSDKDVSFVTLGRPYRGLAYTHDGAKTFPDECSRHLIGMWWMFVEDTSGIGNCPFGYQFQEGP